MTIGICGLTIWAVPALAFLINSPWLAILIYPEAAVAFLLLGTALYMYVKTPPEGRAHAVVSLIGGLTSFLAIMDIEAWNASTPPSVHRFFSLWLESPHIAYKISPWNTLSLLGVSVCIFFLPLSFSQRHRRITTLVGSIAGFLLLANGTILLSYFYGTPLFQETAWTLPGLTSALASAALAVGVISALGPRHFPLRPLVGPSVRARLLRTFLPVGAAAVLIHSLVQDTAFSHLNPVISVTVTAFIAVLIAGVLVIRSAHLVSHQIERAVRESEQRFGVLVDSLEDYAIFMLDPNGHVVTWNAGSERIFGYRAEEVMGEHFACFYMNDETSRDVPMESLKRAVQYGSYVDQGWRLRDDGTRFWADVTLTPLLEENGRLRGYANVTRDITERKTAEESLRQKTAFVQMLQVVSSAANESSSIEHAMQICLDQVCRQTGWPIGHSLIVSPLHGMLESANWHIADGARYAAFRDDEGDRKFESGEGLPGRVMASGASAWIRDITKDLNFPRWRSAEKIGLKGGYAFPVKVGSEVVAVLEFFSEEPAEANPPLLEVMAHIGTQLGRVVERSRAEAALRESEMRFRSVAQSANDAIVSCNAYGLIIAWNKGARAIFGYAEEEMLGNALSLSVPDCMRILSADNKELLLSGPHSIFGRTVESVGRNKAGEEFPIELSVADWKIGEDVFFTAIIRNILKRKEAEAHISASLREKEVLLKEIHHRVKNNLQVISSLLRLQSQHVTDEKTLDMFRESQNRVKSMALIHEYLYQSRDMAHINFSEYIRNLTAHLFRSYGVTPDAVHLDLHVDESPLDLDTAIPCGLIITELVSNSLKHAFPEGRKGRMDVSFHAFDGGRKFELAVKDDGVGLPAGIDLEHTVSLGLRLVRTLTQQLGGRLRMETREGTQTVIEFTNPLKGPASA
jgi:PAS domain S-box-containing protein